MDIITHELFALCSETEPQFIHLTYKPVSTDSTTPIKKVAAIGKGLLFDTGGYNIKTAMMELMKFDCGAYHNTFILKSFSIHPLVSHEMFYFPLKHVY